MLKYSPLLKYDRVSLRACAVDARRGFCAVSTAKGGFILTVTVEHLHIKQGETARSMMQVHFTAI